MTDLVYNIDIDNELYDPDEINLLEPLMASIGCEPSNERSV